MTKAKSIKPGERKVTVCSACLRACCWQGSFMCDAADMAGTVEKTIAELRAGQYGESPHYWNKDRTDA